MMQILPVDPHKVEVALEIEIDMPAIAYVGIDEGSFIGSCGLAWGHGRCWLWFQTSNARPRHALQILRHTDVLISKARQFGETEIFTVRDTRFETSSRLLEMTGFEFRGDEEGHEIYARTIGGDDVGL